MSGTDRDRAVVTISVEAFLSRLSFGVISFALPLYALHLGMSVASIGVLLSVNVAAQIVAKPLLGGVADHFGHKRTLLVAIAARSSIPLLLVAAHAPWELFAIRLSYGLLQSLRDPPLLAIIAEVGGRKRIASTFAYYETSKNAAASIGRAAAAFLVGLTAQNYALVFAVAFVLSLLPMWVVARYLRDGGAVSAERIASPKSIKQTASAAVKAPAILEFTTLGFLFGATAGMLNLFPVIAVKYFGLTGGEIGIILLSSTAVMMVAGPLFGWLADNVSRSLVLLIRGLANASSSLMYLAFPSFWGVAISKTVDDAGKAAFRPAWGSIMAEVAGTDPTRRARTMSRIDVGEDGGDVVGPVLAGFLLSVWGLPVMLVARVVLALATEVFAARVARRTRHVAEPIVDPRARPVGTALSSKE